MPDHALEKKTPFEKLSIHIDGGARGNPGPAGAGVLIEDQQGRAVFEGGFYLGRLTNNQAEYRALLKALEEADRLGATDVVIFSDSQLLVRQINGEYRVKNASLRDLFTQASSKLRRIGAWTVHHVLREANQRADYLANSAMDAGEDVIFTDSAHPAD